jgi:hypothetical protein
MFLLVLKHGLTIARPIIKHYADLLVGTPVGHKNDSITAASPFTSLIGKDRDEPPSEFRDPKTANKDSEPQEAIREPIP